MDTTDISTAIRDRLIESRVIGDIIYDFSPLMQLSINFGNKRISLGDILLPVDVQSRPTSIDMSYDVLSIPSSFQGSKLVLVRSINSYLNITFGKLSLIFYYIKSKFILRTFHTTLDSEIFLSVLLYQIEIYINNFS